MKPEAGRDRGGAGFADDRRLAAHRMNLSPPDIAADPLATGGGVTKGSRRAM